MSKVTVFYLISSKFFAGLFLGTLILFPHIPNKNPPAYHLFDFLDLTTAFLYFLDLKIFKSTQNLIKKHLFSLQIDEKHNIFSRPTSFLQKSSGKG